MQMVLHWKVSLDFTDDGGLLSDRKVVTETGGPTPQIVEMGWTVPQSRGTRKSTQPRCQLDQG